MKNTEAAISSRMGRVKSLRTGGGGKIFQDWEELPIWGGGTFAGGRSVPHYMP